MIVVMSPGAAPEQIERVESEIEAMGLTPHPIYGVELTVIGAIGDRPEEAIERLQRMEGVERVMPIAEAYKLASHHGRKERSIVRVGELEIGNGNLTVVAGPCSVESEDQILEAARIVRSAGAHMLRGGAFKPRTSPYSFRGHGETALRWLRTAREETGLPVVTEVMDASQIELVQEYADVLQVGARNMQNYTLLDALGKTTLPVVLKRGMSATIEDTLMSAEYILSGGNPNVILCERGVRTFETATRNTFDINAIPVLQSRSHLPVMADPSHGTGYWWLVAPVARAAVAAGADLLMVEVHPNPEVALSDGGQSLRPTGFEALMGELRAMLPGLNRRLAEQPPGAA